MSWLFKREKRAETVPDPKVVAAETVPQTLEEMLSGGGSDIMEIPSVYACVKAISSGIATTPLVVKKKVGKEWVLDDTHPLNALLARPSKLYNRNVFFEKLVEDALLLNGGYALIDMSGGRPSALTKVDANKLIIAPDDIMLPRELFYSIAGMQGTLTGDELICLTNRIAADGYTGAGLKSKAQKTTDLGAILINNATDAFTEGKNQRIVSVKGRGSSTKLSKVRTSLAETKKGGMTVLEADSVNIHDLTTSNKESMLVEARRYSAEEICVFFNVLPAFIGVGTTTTITSDALQAMHMYLVSITLEPWFDKLELELAKLLKTSEFGKYKIEFDRFSNIKMSPKEAADYFSKLVLNGIITPNHAARLLGLPIIEGGEELVIVGGVAPLKLLNDITKAGLDNKLKGTTA